MKAKLRHLLPASLLRTIRDLRRRVRRIRYRPRIVEHTYHNAAYRLRIEDSVAEDWYDHDWPLVPELQLLCTHRLRPGATVFEIGAHQGVVAMVLATIVGTRGRVIALEALPSNAAAMRINLHLNKITNVTVVESAAARGDGQTEFLLQSNGAIDHGSIDVPTIRVQATSLDTLQRRYGTPDVLFIDVEGAEHAVLQGASEVLGCRPDIFVEVHVGCGLEGFGATARDVTDLLDGLGYSLWISSGPGFERKGAAPYVFVPYSADSSILTTRFFLIAIAGS